MTLSWRMPIVTIALAVSVPAAAGAATIEHTAGSGPANEEFLVFRAGKGERNRLTVFSGKKGIVFTDPGARLRRKKGDFGGCRFSRARHRATCDVESFTDLVVYLGDRDDSIHFTGTNATPLGKMPRTNVNDAAKLADRYEDLEGGNYEHAIVIAGAGNDVVRGTGGLDLLDGGRGRDHVDGGAGPDRIIDHPDQRADKLLGGRGVDTVDGEGGVPLTIDLAAGTFSTTAGDDTDTLDSFERARGGFVDDNLTGTEGPDGLFGDNGRDTVDGLGGNDYLGGDLGPPQRSEVGSPGADTLTGGPGDDVLDARDTRDRLTPTDRLLCGEGDDRIVALQDDLADPDCESSAFGKFTGDLYFDQEVAYGTRSRVTPVARAADGSPTYEIACYGGFSGDSDCTGTVRLEEPPAQDGTPAVLGTSDEFTIEGGSKTNVTVTLNDAGRAALAQPGARASVHVVVSRAEFGWQQLLGPP
jgi:Ca2+-binding RTX toxin-like protein